MNTLLNGIWSGVLATGPMTVTLFQMQDKAKAPRKNALPFAKITGEALDSNAVTRPLLKNGHQNLTLLSHFGYGIACAAVYAFVSPKIKVAPTTKGAAFGFAVWAGSYMGWLPALGFKTNSENLTSRRNLQMIMAHLVWGAALGRSEHAIRERGQQMLTSRPGLFKR